VAIQLFAARTEHIRKLTQDVKEIRFALLKPDTIDFKPGQFVSFDVLNPRTGRTVTRPYSIASPPSQRNGVMLVLNLVPDGPGSTYLFGLREGDVVEFKGAAGTFYLRDEPDRDLLFIATGTGIAPFRSMLHDLADRRFPRGVTLYWGLRRQQDLYYQDELEALAGRLPGFTAVTTLSRPEPGWTGETGRVTRLAEERVRSVKHLAVYLCGNSGMLQDVSEIINKKGLCPIRKEKWYDDAGAPDD
jgi:NAD(P)H-flavin reductase